jgi:hypothetical protein
MNKKCEGNLELNCGWYAHCRGVNKVILNWQRPLWKGEHKVVEGSGSNEAMWVSIYKCIEAMLGISLHSYLISY